jgi:hypothetical protein
VVWTPTGRKNAIYGDIQKGLKTALSGSQYIPSALPEVTDCLQLLGKVMMVVFFVVTRRSNSS